jgi:hypothetical protein
VSLLSINKKLGGYFMKLHEVIDLYIKVSNKADTYWTIFIVITASIIAVPLPKVSLNPYFFVSGIVVIYIIFVYIDYWALSQVYKFLRLLARQIQCEIESGRSENLHKELSGYLQDIPKILLGEWHGITHFIAVFIVTIISFLKIS